MLKRSVIVYQPSRRKLETELRRTFYIFFYVRSTTSLKGACARCAG
jgi:hypothetical protein